MWGCVGSLSRKKLKSDRKIKRALILIFVSVTTILRLIEEKIKGAVKKLGSGYLKGNRNLKVRPRKKWLLTLGF